MGTSIRLWSDSDEGVHVQYNTFKFSLSHISNIQIAAASIWQFYPDATKLVTVYVSLWCIRIIFKTDRDSFVGKVEWPVIEKMKPVLGHNTRPTIG